MTGVLKFDIREYQIIECWPNQTSNNLISFLWLILFFESLMPKKNQQNLVISSCYGKTWFFYIDYHSPLILINFSVKLILISSTDLLLFIKYKGGADTFLLLSQGGAIAFLMAFQEWANAILTGGNLDFCGGTLRRTRDIFQIQANLTRLLTFSNDHYVTNKSVYIHK